LVQLCVFFSKFKVQKLQAQYLLHLISFVFKVKVILTFQFTYELEEVNFTAFLSLCIFKIVLMEIKFY